MAVGTSTIDGTLLLTIDRPPVNALDLATIAELEWVFAAATREAPQGGVVLTGGGRVFSADARSLYHILADIGGEELVGPARELAAESFYRRAAGD